MARTSTAMPLLRARREAETVAALVEILTAQRDDVQARFESGARTLLSKAWDARLAEVMLGVNDATASEVALRVAKALHGRDHGFDPKVMGAWLAKNAEIAAEARNRTTRDDLAAAKAAEDIEDPVDHVYGLLLTAGAATMAASMATRSMNFGGRDAARHAGARLKVWNTGANPRVSHAALSGQTVGIDALFSNGGAHPGDPALSAAENANCNCSMTFVS